MNTYPTLSIKPAKVTESTFSNFYKVVSASNYPMLAKKGTRIVREWKVEYDQDTMLNSSDKTALGSFFNVNMGLFFTWVNPETSVSHAVFFDIDSLQFIPIFLGINYYTCTFVLREA